VRVARGSDLLPALRAAGYRLEACANDPAATLVVEIPVDAGAGARVARDVTMWEQLGFAAFLQRHWADNQVSCTVTFDPAREGPQLVQALEMFQFQLKGVSFLPRIEAGAYPQMPYEGITKEEYDERIREIDFSVSFQDISERSQRIEEMPDKFCDMAGCSIEEDPNDR